MLKNNVYEHILTFPGESMIFWFDGFREGGLGVSLGGFLWGVFEYFICRFGCSVMFIVSPSGFIILFPR